MSKVKCDALMRVWLIALIVLNVLIAAKTFGALWIFHTDVFGRWFAETVTKYQPTATPADVEAMEGLFAILVGFWMIVFGLLYLFCAVTAYGILFLRLKAFWWHVGSTAVVLAMEMLYHFPVVESSMRFVGLAGLLGLVFRGKPSAWARMHGNDSIEEGRQPPMSPT